MLFTCSWSSDGSVNFQPLRPFTILPAGAGERARLQSEVFRPDHRLPSMSIDQYLEEEQRRGNIISGGGSALFHLSTLPHAYFFYL